MAKSGRWRWSAVKICSIAWAWISTPGTAALSGVGSQIEQARARARADKNNAASISARADPGSITAATEAGIKRRGSDWESAATFGRWRRSAIALPMRTCVIPLLAPLHAKLVSPLAPEALIRWRSSWPTRIASAASEDRTDTNEKRQVGG